MTSKIKIKYPKTGYTTLDQSLVEQLNLVVKEFIEYEKVIAGQDLDYSLDIIDEKHSYSDFISYVFYASIYTGGAHPNSVVFTTNFDSRQNKIITVDDLFKNETVLNNVCEECRKKLKHQKNIGKDESAVKIMMDATYPNKNNYKNFMIGQNGITIYFQQYQIAPYASGVFQVEVPFDLFEK